MTTSTKEQIQKLTPEQQEVFGSLIAQQVYVRQKLIERVQGGRQVLTGLLIGLATGLAILSIVYPRALLFAVIVVAGLVVRVETELSRRMNALLELLDQDRNQATEGRTGTTPTIASSNEG